MCLCVVFSQNESCLCMETSILSFFFFNHHIHSRVHTHQTLILEDLLLCFGGRVSICVVFNCLLHVQDGPTVKVHDKIIIKKKNKLRTKDENHSVCVVVLELCSHPNLW